jgi:hypothetical protein
MIRYFLAQGDRAGSAVITEGLESVTCSNPPPRVKIATLYMKTYCRACNQEGFIAPKGPRRPGTGPNGQPWALSGDINICGCSPPPVFYAERGMSMTFTAENIATLNAPPASSRSVAATTSPQSPLVERTHSRWFFISDSTTGESLRNRDFIANIAGIRQIGQTDSNGYAQISTDGEQPVEIHVIFEAPRRKLNPRGA